jgi:hypothetical protein
MCSLWLGGLCCRLYWLLTKLMAGWPLTRGCEARLGLTAALGVPAFEVASDCDRS